MLLRVSGETTGTSVDLTAINGEVGTEPGIEHAAELVAFTEAVMGTGDEELDRARTALRSVLGDEAFVDTCAVIAAFNVVDRIADATGIPLDDPFVGITAEMRAQLDLARFRSSANTPGAGT